MNIKIPQIPDDTPLSYIILPIGVIFFIFYILFRPKIQKACTKSFNLTLNTLYVEKTAQNPYIEENFLLKIKSFFDSMTNQLIIYNKKMYTNTSIKKINNNKNKRK
jgi:hypothetical protein